jgi:hypothetical protein
MSHLLMLMKTRSLIDQTELCRMFHVSFCESIIVEDGPTHYDGVGVDLMLVPMSL